MSFLPSGDPEPETLKELAEYLSNNFQDNYKRNHKSNASNASRYLSQQCFHESDSFRDKMGQFDSNQFSFTQFGDELQPKEDTSGTKRSGTELHGPSHKKRKLNTETDDDEMKNNQQNDGESDNADDDDDDIDIFDDDDDDDDDNDNKNKKNKKKKLKLPEKYKDDEDFQSLEAPPLHPSKASSFFDFVNYCNVNLEKESSLHIKTKEYLNNYELFNPDDVDIDGKDIKYVDKNEIETFLKENAIKNGFTVQKEVSTVLCLGLKDHLKNMMDEMNKWRLKRIDKMEHHEDDWNPKRYKIRYNEMDKQQLIDTMNSKYSVKQQIYEAKDEIGALTTEKSDLDFKKMTGILTDEETKRRERLDGLIKKVKDKQKQNDKLKADFSLAAVGGDFSFQFGAKNGNKKRDRVLDDKFYVIDAINMIENHQKYNQQYLKQLSKLCLKNV